jgi:DNA-binding NarL/FixJ family response regulator
MPISDLLSADWKPPQKLPSLTGRQTIVLGALAKGGSLSEAGARIGLTGPAMASHMSLIYTRLGIRHRYEYRDDRRAAAIQIAREYHLINEGTDDQAHG